MGTYGCVYIHINSSCMLELLRKEVEKHSPSLIIRENHFFLGGFCLSFAINDAGNSLGK